MSQPSVQYFPCKNEGKCIYDPRKFYQRKMRYRNVLRFFPWSYYTHRMQATPLNLISTSLDIWFWHTRDLRFQTVFRGTVQEAMIWVKFYTSKARLYHLNHIYRPYFKTREQTPYRWARVTSQGPVSPVYTVHHAFWTPGKNLTPGAKLSCSAITSCMRVWWY